MTRTARCSCVQLRVACEGEPEKVSICHCNECRKRTGSAFGIAAFYPRSAVAISGDGKTFTRKAESGFDVVQHFCPRCGATVYWEPTRKPDMVAVAVGAFADPNFPAPDQAVQGDLAHDWLMFPPSIKTRPGW